MDGEGESSRGPDRDNNGIPIPPPFDTECNTYVHYFFPAIDPPPSSSRNNRSVVADSLSRVTGSFFYVVADRFNRFFLAFEFI